MVCVPDRLKPCGMLSLRFCSPDLTPLKKTGGKADKHVPGGFHWPASDKTSIPDPVTESLLWKTWSRGSSSVPCFQCLTKLRLRCARASKSSIISSIKNASSGCRLALSPLFFSRSWQHFLPTAFVSDLRQKFEAVPRDDTYLTVSGRLTTLLIGSLLLSLFVHKGVSYG